MYSELGLEAPSVRDVAGSGRLVQNMGVWGRLIGLKNRWEVRLAGGGLSKLEGSGHVAPKKQVRLRLILLVYFVAFTNPMHG